MQIRRGFSYLELQVAMVLFAIAVGGVGPLAVVHSRHIRRIEQRFPPGQPQLLAPAPSLWERKLGTAAEAVDAFPPAKPDPLVIDDGGAGYRQINRESSDWYYWRWSQVYDNDVRFNYPDDAGDLAVWTFTDLLPGEYQVLVTWRPLNFLAHRARYRVFDGSKRVRTRTIDQRSWPSGPTLDGFRWQILDTVDLQSSTVRVDLRDGDRGYIAVDAARLVPVTNELEVITLSEFPETRRAQATIKISGTVK